ncbi:hypothetical protein DUNSADRAFT_18361 [Dunaliella salina]|uniref:Uncharacterized protein n=1 Tax=Dunaliella salina TaxID=3046 RepID=A0ABQ7G083_DUNSA|nr:hypothetical protein DUNSADRAFT_18361 [Dunaliella salina]|eukprot:KAF5828012.1 hypothetical protein DUNSADRAFT_18361 [Dunaliella salina]
MLLNATRRGGCSLAFQRAGLHQSGCCSLRPPSADPSHHQRSLCIAHASPSNDVSVFLEEIAVAQTPKRLKALIRVLEAQGGKALPPTDRAGLHPLLVPVCELGTAAGLPPSANVSGQVACLLRWPVPILHKNMPMPIVTMERGSKKVRLLSRSVNEHLHRPKLAIFCEMDANTDALSRARPVLGTQGAKVRPSPSSPQPLSRSSSSSSSSSSQAAGSESSEIYSPGKAEASGFGGPKAALYVVSRAGYFPDVCEGLAHKHLARGDKLSALIASEWYMRNDFFPGWGRPYEFGAELLADQKRDEEARDMARVAMRLPWWTLNSEFASIQEMAQLKGRSPEETRYLLSEEAAAAAQVQTQGAAKEVKTPQQADLWPFVGLDGC